MEARKRSIGVTFIGGVMLIGGLFTLLGSFAPRLSSRLPGLFLLKCFYFPLAFFFGSFLVGPLAFSLGLFYFLIGVGILRLKNWARFGAIYLSGLAAVVITVKLINLIFCYATTSSYSRVYLPAGITGHLFLLILYSLVIVFFTRCKVKGQFKG